jgi:hypothetical protein
VTPEGKVKEWIKRWLDKHEPTHWRVMPRGGPFGKGGTPDFILCWRGIFVAIEAKAEDGTVSPLQMNQLRNIQAAGGVAAVVRGKDETRMRAIMYEVHRRCHSVLTSTPGQLSRAESPSATSAVQ